MSYSNINGELVRWYRYDLNGRICEAGHGVILDHTDHVFSKENEDLNTYEILIDGTIEIFAKRDFVIIEQEAIDDPCEKE